MPDITIMGVVLGMFSMFLCGMGIFIITGYPFLSWWGVLGLLLVSPTAVLTNMGADCLFRNAEKDCDCVDCEYHN